MGDFFLIETREGTPSLGYKEGERKITLHSSYTPSLEASRFIISRKNDIQNAGVILVYGLGMGYHIKELEKHVSPDTKVYVLETNLEIIKYTEQVFSISEYKKRGFTFFISDRLNEVKSFLSNIINGIDDEKFLLLIHKPSLEVIPKSLSVIKHILEDWEIKRETFQSYASIMNKNFGQNILRIDEYYSLEPFKDRFKNMPVVIVSAGPSLNKNKHLLPELKGKAVVLAVGSVAKPLVEMGFIPDCMIITDPHPITSKQIEGLNLNVPLFFFPTIQHSIVKKYKGPKVLLLQKGYEKSEQLAFMKSLSLIKTGGSVATTALELAIFLGGNPIIFVGQDLAYTNGKSHAEGVTSNQFKPKLNSRWVKGIDGKMIPTGKALSIYLNWIQNRIRQNPHINFIDATEGGAYIEGTKVMPLKKVINKLTTHIPVDCLLNESLKKETEA